MRLALLLTPLLVTGGLAPAAQAAVCLWTGTTGTSWHTASSWSCGRIPTTADDVTLSAFNNVPALSAPITARSLTVLQNTRVVVPSGAALGSVVLAEGGILTVDTTPATVGSLGITSGARLDGTATVTVTGGLTLGAGRVGIGTGGTLVLAPGSVSSVAVGGGESAAVSGHTLRNEGTLRWTLGSVQVFSDGRIVNAGLLEASSEGAMQTLGGTGTGFLDNLAGGTVRKTGAGTTTLGGQQGIALSNSGTVEVTAGTLQIGSGLGPGVSLSGGRVEVAAGATLRFSGNSTFPQPYTLAAASVVTGAGTVEITGGSLVSEGTFTPAAARVDGQGTWQIAASATATPGTLTVAGGSVSGTGLDAGGRVRVPGPFVWSGGRVGLQGVVEVRAEGPAPLGGGLLLDGGTVTIAGTGLWAAGDVTGGGTLAVAPGATLEMRAAAALVSPSGQGTGVLLNAGTLRKTGPAVTTVGGPQGFRLDNRGLVDVAEGTLRLDGTFPGAIPQTAGTFRLAGGSVDGTRPVLIDGGALDGSGAVANAVTVGSAAGSAATLAPGGPGSVGTLSLGALTLRSGAVVDVELGGVGASDRVEAGGNVGMAGTLRVRLRPGFVPAVGDRFPVVTCSGLCSGVFATLDLPAGLSGEVQTSAAKAEFVVTGVVAGEGAPGVPDALALVLAPNPARGAVSVQIALPAAAEVRVSVVDLLGREVAVLADGARAAGTHTLALAAARLAPGVYAVRLVTPTGTLGRRLTVTR